MMGTGHRFGGAVLVLGLGLLQPELDIVSVAAATAIAVPFSAGRWSPDADNRGWLKAAAGHRRIVHWWGWPVAVLVVLVVLGAPWPLLAPPLGWISHILLDIPFGKGGPSIPMGVPALPFRDSPRWGLGLRVSADRGRLEESLIGSRRTHSFLEYAASGLLAVALGMEVLYAVRR